MEVEPTPIPDNEEGCYTVTADPDLVSSFDNPEYDKFKEKSFHLDHYCFDSNPEKELFWKLLNNGSVQKVWFTGMLTQGQSDFFISYIDPHSHTLRHYYPDFLIKHEDGSYTILEVKAANQIDDAIVQAKADYANQMATSSGMMIFIASALKYIITCVTCLQH